MNSIKFFCLTGMILFIQNLMAQDANQAMFEKYLTTIYNAYLNGGWNGIKKYYSPTAVEIDPQGNIITGLDALEKNYAMLESMTLGKPKFTYKLKSYRLIKSDVAIIYWDGADEVTLKNGPSMKFEYTCSAVLVKSNENWLIESTQLTPKISFSDPAEDQLALEKLGEKAYGAFDSRDAKKFASVFAEDAIFISPEGSVIIGREAIEKTHIDLFKQWANTKKISSAITGNTIRPLSQDVVVLHWMDKTTYNMNGNNITETLAFSNTCVKKDGNWLIAAFSMTPVTQNNQPLK